MPLGLSAVRAHIAPLAFSEFSELSPWLYCSADGTWWATHSYGCVGISGGDPRHHGAYLADGFVRAVDADDNIERARFTERPKFGENGVWPPLDPDNGLVLGWLGSPLRKWRRSKHRVADVLERCGPPARDDEEPRVVPVGSLLGHVRIHPLDAVTLVGSGLLREMLALSPNPVVSWFRRSPREALVFRAGAWTSVVMPVRDQEFAAASKAAGVRWSGVATRVPFETEIAAQLLWDRA